MYVEFATCERQRALRYIQHVYPSKTVTDTPDSAGPLLDLVEQDVVRVQDPQMYGPMIAIVPGDKWVEDVTKRAEVAAVASTLHERMSRP